MAEANARLALRIRKAREKKGLSQAAFAVAVGADKRTVERWENAQRHPQPAKMLAISRELELPMKELRPDLEAEERGLQNQLNRIETKLNRLLARLGVNPNDNGSKP